MRHRREGKGSTDDGLTTNQTTQYAGTSARFKRGADEGAWECVPSVGILFQGRRSSNMIRSDLSCVGGERQEGKGERKQKA